MSGDLRFTMLRLPSGLGLHVAEQGVRDSPVVLMLHGYTDSWFSFSRILPLLPWDLHVLVPDQRGHGASDRPSDGYTPDDFAGDAIQLLDRLGIEKASVVGHSMGSFVAQRLAARVPERVSHRGSVRPADAGHLHRHHAPVNPHGLNNPDLSVDRGSSMSGLSLAIIAALAAFEVL